MKKRFGRLACCILLFTCVAASIRLQIFAAEDMTEERGVKDMFMVGTESRVLPSYKIRKLKLHMFDPCLTAVCGLW